MLADESNWTRCRSIGDRIGSRAVGGSGEIEAVGREARSGVRISSERGGYIAVCIALGVAVRSVSHANMKLSKDLNRDLEVRNCSYLEINKTTCYFVKKKKDK